MSLADKKLQWQTSKKYLDYIKDQTPKKRFEIYSKFGLLAVFQMKAAGDIRDKYLYENLLEAYSGEFIAPLKEKIEAAYQVRRKAELEKQRLLDEKMKMLKVEIMAKRNEFTTAIDKERAKLEAELNEKEAVLRKLEMEETQRIKAEVGELK